MMDKTSVLVRVPSEQWNKFNDLYPWHGSMTQFFLQSLEEFLKLAEGSKTPAQLTQEAVTSVYRKDY